MSSIVTMRASRSFDAAAVNDGRVNSFGCMADEAPVSTVCSISTKGAPLELFSTMK